MCSLRTRSARLLPTLVVLSACLSPRGSPVAGTEVACPDGSRRVVAQCGNVANLKQRVLEGNAGLQKFGLGLSAKFEEQALAQITTSTQQLALSLDAQCAQYNACAIDGERWLGEERRLLEHVRLVEALRSRPGAESGNALWENAAPQLAERRLELELEVQARTPGAAFRAHESGAPLASGDELRFVVRSNQAAYLYLLLVPSHGEPEQLFPNAALQTNNPLPAGSAMIPPASYGVFTLDRDPGRERLQLVASTGPLADIAARLAGLGKRSDAREKLLASVSNIVCEPGAARGMTLTQAGEPCAGRTTRGITLSQKRADGAHEYLLKAEPNDQVIVVEHAIDHRARATK